GPKTARGLPPSRRSFSSRNDSLVPVVDPIKEFIVLEHERSSLAVIRELLEYHLLLQWQAYKYHRATCLQRRHTPVRRRGRRSHRESSGSPNCCQYAQMPCQPEESSQV